MKRIGFIYGLLFCLVLSVAAQKKAMEYYGWPEAQFIQEFGRSYL